MPHHHSHHHHHLIKSCLTILRHHHHYDHHHLNGSLGAALVVEADEAKAFALVRSSVNEHLGVNCEGSYNENIGDGGKNLGADDISKR